MTNERQRQAKRMQRDFGKACKASLGMMVIHSEDAVRHLIAETWQEGYRLGMQHTSAQQPEGDVYSAGPDLARALLEVVAWLENRGTSLNAPLEAKARAALKKAGAL